MGNSYYNNVSQWSKGEYTGANNTQDDISIIGTKLGFVSDDHGNTRETATALNVSASGEIAVSNPETDADNVNPANKGMIGQRGDKDVFRVAVNAGPVVLTATPAWDAFYRTDKRGANLDLRLVLTDAQGTQVAASDPSDNTDATISTTVPAGVYYLEVTTVGSANYSDYASEGEYFVSGQVTPSTVVNQAPAAAFDFACTGTSCNFTDTSSDSDGQIASRSWTFGDGGTGTGPSPSHTYAIGGVFTATLTVTDDSGDTDTATVKM